jgi:DNA-binding transcriptional ArsR family regulator
MVTEDDIAACLEALGNPTRLRIFKQLVRAGATGLPVGAVQQRIGIAASTLSHHLQKLKTVGLIGQVRDGTTLYCRADFAAMRTVADYLAAECCVDEVCAPATERKSA